MTIRTNGIGTALASTNGTLIYLFEFLDFMRQASPTGPGWTIPLSSDGTTGGAGDNINAFLDLDQYTAGVSESWFVLQEPGGGREYLWARGGALNTQWILTYSPAAGFTGGSITAAPTATDEVTIHALDAPMMSGNNVLHVGADDAAPYGWHVYVNASGDLTNPQAAMAQIPITAGTDPAETDPMVFYYDGGGSGYVVSNALASESATTTSARCAGIVPGTTSWEAIPALTQNVGSNAVYPDNVPQNTNSDDLKVPIAFVRRGTLPAPQGHKGVTDFMQWNGVMRAPGETFKGLECVSWGVVNFPWDGASVPSPAG